MLPALVRPLLSVLPQVSQGKLTGMFYILAIVAFIIAAIIALLRVSGVTTEQVIGIIAIGLALLAMAGPDWPAWGRRVGP